MRDIPLLLGCIFIGTVCVSMGGYLFLYPVDFSEYVMAAALTILGATFWYLGWSLFWKK